MNFEISKPNSFVGIFHSVQSIYGYTIVKLKWKGMANILVNKQNW